MALLLVAGCSSSGTGSGNTTISLGLAGSTANNPSAPPSVAGNGPNGVYAFVYDDQIWIHKSNGLAPVQVTHLVLSRGADITWGPLVWSPDGTHIAFALVQNLTPSTPDGVAGPIYVVDTSDGNTVVTPGIGSVYGHNYAWYGPNMLFFSSGDGISMYDYGDPDPRVWSVLTSFTTPDDETFSSNNVVFGDIAVTQGTQGGSLYYSAAQITNLGGAGTSGKRWHLPGAAAASSGLHRRIQPVCFHLTGYYHGMALPALPAAGSSVELVSGSRSRSGLRRQRRQRYDWVLADFLERKQTRLAGDP